MPPTTAVTLDTGTLLAVTGLLGFLSSALGLIFNRYAAAQEENKKLLMAQIEALRVERDLFRDEFMRLVEPVERGVALGEELVRKTRRP
jgi:hypothetical protein